MKTFCEYLVNPVGLDMRHPRFSWIVQEDGTAQKAYQIRVTDAEGKLVWDTGRVESAVTLGAAYSGEELRTAGVYHYRVKVWCTSGLALESEEGSFTMGILDEPVWEGSWIGGPGMEIQAFWFRTEEEIKKELKNAFIYVVSPNYYVLTVNGKRCSEAVLQNANTDPAKSLLYATYPVLEFLRQGKNAIGIELGNGWKALNLGRTNAGVGEHLFSLRLRLEYADRTCEWVNCDAGKWKYTTAGPLKENSIYHGERYDARDEIPMWDEPEFTEEASGVTWFDAVEFEPEEGVVKAQYLEPIRVVRQLKPAAVHALADGSYVFDMGQNFAGWARLKIAGKRGTEIRLVYAELENEDHSVNQMSLRHMRATDTYILKGEGTEVFEPDFTYHGFRYVQVFGLPQPPAEDTITGCVVRSAVERVGEFTCDHELLARLQSNICWTEESNLHSLPTDCPQRDERLGWTNDMTVRNECAMYNYRLHALYRKWLGDIRDTQGKITGAIADTAPFRVFGCRPADPVGASLTLLPWNMYLHYGDVEVIRENYEANKKFLGYLERNSTDYIVRWSHMGDWAAPIGDNDRDSIGGGAVSVVTPTRMIATAFYHYECVLMSKMAEVLGRTEDSRYFRELAEKIKDAFLRHFYNAEEKYVSANSQGGNTIALYMNLIPEEDRKAVFENLIKDIVSVHDYHLTTGNLCSRYLIEILLDNGYEEIAYQLLTQTTYPSWGYEIERGATTIWERWEEVVSDRDPLSMMASYNHPMYGAVGVCFYKYLAGIRNEDKAGFEEFEVKPVIVEKLKSASAKVETVRGTIESGWRCEDGKLSMYVAVPFNCRAKIYLPKRYGSRTNTVFMLNEKNLKEMKDSKTMEDMNITENLNIAEKLNITGDFNIAEDESFVVISGGAGRYQFSCAE